MQKSAFGHFEINARTRQAFARAIAVTAVNLVDLY